jgi:aspartate aminotransferase
LIPRLAALPGFECRPPAGAFYAFPRVAGAYRPGRQGSGAFAEFLLEHAGVAVVPGEAFGSDEHIRLSFACSLETLAQGIDRMGAVLAD